MGLWGFGPFDNDSAADWCAGLDEADPDDRADMVRQTLLSAAESTGFLDAFDVGYQAMAAIAIVAAECRGGPPITSAYAPDFLLEGGRIGLSGDFVPLALRALDRVLGKDSELWQFCEEDDGGRALLAEIEPLRAALTRGTTG